MRAVEWHGDKAFSTCADCGKFVRLNKPVFGSAHLCITDCEKAQRHLDIQTRRRGPFWARRTETYCSRCDARLSGVRTPLLGPSPSRR